MQKFIISPSVRKYNFIKRLGKGASGTVYLCQDTYDNQHYAIKKVSSQFKDEKEIALFLVNNFKDVKHVVKFYEVFEVPNNKNFFYIRMEYCNQDSLYDDIQNYKFKDEEITSIALQIARGIKELHDNKIIHRDIKPENIISHQDETKRAMSYGTKQYKICDLGISKHNTLSARTQFIGTPYYIAPEMIQLNHGTNSYDGKVDIWALGCVIYEMITSETLFEGTSLIELQQQIRETKTDQKTKQRILGIQNIQFRILLNQMIEPQAKNRLDIDKVITELDIILKTQKKIRIIQPWNESSQNYIQPQVQDIVNKSPQNYPDTQNNTQSQQVMSIQEQKSEQTEQWISQPSTQSTNKDNEKNNQISQNQILQNSNNVTPQVQQLSQVLIDKGFLKIYGSSYFQQKFSQTQKNQNIAPKTIFLNFEQIVHTELYHVANQ